MYSGLVEVISLPSPLSATHSPPKEGKLCTQTVTCSGGAWSPLALVLLTHGIDRGWRRELKFRGWTSLKGGTASAKIPTYQPTRWHLPSTFKIDSSFLFSPQYCSTWVSVAPEKTPPSLFFQRWKGFGLKLAPVQRWKLYEVFLSVSVVQLFMICHIPTLKNFFFVSEVGNCSKIFWWT